MVNAQEWLDKEYPTNRRNEITELDISKGKVKRWDGHERTLKGDLKLEGFTNLRKLIISSHQITSLDTSNCPNLEELDCCDNELNNLNINGCYYLNKISCSNNNIKELDLNTCTRLEKINCVGNNFLEEIDISNCLDLTEIGSGFTHDDENKRLVKGSLITKAREDDIRNILIIGWAGNGKSTLANVISGTDVFAESAGGMGQTLSFKKSDVFQWQDKKYRIIDNIGFGDNNVPDDEDLLRRIGEGIYSAQEGINQVLFVFSGRFSEEQVLAFNMFKKFVAETGITKFTTIIRTHFPNFRNPKKCQEDKDSLLTQKEELKKIIKSCNDLIYVDNPPAVEEDSSGNEQEVPINKKKRENSREIVLNHLANNCPNIYKLKEWDNIYSLVVDHIKKKAEIEQSNNSTKEEQLKQEWKEITKEIKLRLEADPLTGKAAIEIGYLSKKVK